MLSESLPFLSRRWRLMPLVFGLMSTGMPLRGQEEHCARNSEPLSPNQAVQGLKVREGFHVQLCADETLIGGKPINMAFAARGRLWVSSTREYPYAVPKNKWSPDTTAAP